MAPRERCMTEIYCRTVCLDGSTPNFFPPLINLRNFVQSFYEFPSSPSTGLQKDHSHGGRTCLFPPISPNTQPCLPSIVLPKLQAHQPPSSLFNHSSQPVQSPHWLPDSDHPSPSCPRRLTQNHTHPHSPQSGSACRSWEEAPILSASSTG